MIRRPDPCRFVGGMLTAPLISLFINPVQALLAQRRSVV